MTPLEKQQQFYKELKELLLKHKAEILIEQETIQGYFEKEKIVVEFEFDESLFKKHNTGIIPALDLGTYEDGKKTLV